MAALALLDSSAERQPRGRRLQYRLLLAIIRHFGLNVWLARSQIAPLMFAERTRRERPELVGEFVRGASALPREAVVRAALAVAIDAPPLLDELHVVSAPALVLCGREDRAYPAGTSERLVRAIPGARLAWIEDAGHLTVLERPDEVNRVLLPFVGEVLR